MTTKMTKRDKILLYVLAVVLVIAGFIWLIILPQMNRSSALDLSITEAEALQLPMQAAVMGLEDMRTVVKEAENKREAALANFYPHMQNYEIEKTLTDIMMDKYGLRVASLVMSTVPTGRKVPRYINAPAPETAEGDAATSDEAVATVQAEAETVDNLPVLSSDITLSATGSAENIQRCVDDLFQNYPAIRITGYTFYAEDQGTLDLSCEFYMQVQ